MASLEIADGDAQEAEIGSALPRRLQVVARDAAGQGLARVPITWSPQDGTIVPAVDTTDEAGVAVAQWTLGGRQGVQLAHASAELFSVHFTANASPAPPARLVVRPDSVVLTALHDSVVVQVEVRDRFDNVLWRTLTWRSLDPAVATVAGGVVRSVADGMTALVVSAEALTVTVPVRVRQQAAGVYVGTASDTLDLVGDSVVFAATVLDRRGVPLRQPRLHWGSSDTAVAVVSATGAVLGRKPGRAVVTVTCDSASTSIAITVAPRAGRVLITPLADTMKALGQKTQLRATIYDHTGREAVCAGWRWSSDDATVAEVDASGLVLSHGNGSTRVFAACGLTRDSTAIVVRQVLASMRLSTDVAGMLEGDTVALRLSGADANGHPMPAVADRWSSDAPGTATAASGRASGVRFGLATITAAAGAVTASTQVYVIARRARFGGMEPSYGRTCAITGVGAALCWGLIYEDPWTGHVAGLPEAVPGNYRFQDLAVAGDAVCGATSDGLRCWGVNNHGALGDGTTQLGISPVLVVGALSKPALGAMHACALDADGRAFCWGRNVYGQLGRTPTSNDPAPAPGPVATDVRFRELAAGRYFTCGIATDDLTYCWGDASLGATGRGAGLGKQTDPMPVSSSIHFTQLVAAGGYACGLAPGHEVYCWGSQSYGYGTQSTPLGTPTVRPGSYIALSGGAEAEHICAWTPALALHCWGSNNTGQLGIGQASMSGEGDVAGGKLFLAVSTARDYTCGIATDGQAYCWGMGPYGTLGDGSKQSMLQPTRPVAGGAIFR